MMRNFTRLLEVSSAKKAVPIRCNFRLELVACFFLSLLLAACGDNTATPAASVGAATTSSASSSAGTITSVASTAGSGTTTATTAQAGSNGSVTELTFFYPVLVPGPITKLFDKLSADFTAANPDIKINTVFSGSYDDTTNKIQTILQGGGAPPDLAIIGNQHTAMYVDMDAIIPLDDFIKGEGDAYINDFVPAFMLNTKFKGKTWSIPYQRSTPVMYYNKTMFKEAGLDPEKPPQNWQEVIDYAKKLTKRDAAGKTTVWGVEIPSDIDAWVIQAMAVGNGRPWVNEQDDNKVFFNDPATSGVLQYLRDLANVHQVMPGGLIPWAQLPTEFTSGKTAIIYHTIGSQTSILSQTQGKFDVGVGFIPAGSKGYGVVTGGGNLAIFKKSSPAKQQAAWRFIRFLTQPDKVAEWSAGTGYLPVRNSAYDQPSFKDYLAKAPGTAVARDQLKYAAKQMGVHELLKVTDIIKANIQASITGEKSPQQAVEDAQKDADRILARFKE